MADSIDDVFLRQAVLGEGYKNSSAAKLVKMVEKALDDVIADTAKTDFSKMRRADQKAFYSKVLKKLNNPSFGRAAMNGATAYGIYENEFIAQAIQNAAKNRGINFIPNIATSSQIRAAANSKILTTKGPGGGMLLKSFLNTNIKKNAERVVGSIRVGVALGETTPAIVSRIRKEVGASKRAITAIVRTGTSAAASAARMDFAKRNDDVIGGVKWVSTLDTRTSSTCRSLDGEEFDMKEGPRPPAHVNCRSTITYVFKGGLKEMQEQGTRAARNPKTGKIEYVSAKETYYDWLGKQSAEYQDFVLGRGKGRIFRSQGMTAEKFRKLELNKTFQPRSLKQIEGMMDQAMGAVAKSVEVSVFAKFKGALSKANTALTVSRYSAMALERYALKKGDFKTARYSKIWYEKAEKIGGFLSAVDNLFDIPNLPAYARSLKDILMSKDYDPTNIMDLGKMIWKASGPGGKLIKAPAIPKNFIVNSREAIKEYKKFRIYLDELAGKEIKPKTRTNFAPGKKYRTPDKKKHQSWDEMDVAKAERSELEQRWNTASWKNPNTLSARAAATMDKMDTVDETGKQPYFDYMKNRINMNGRNMNTRKGQITWIHENGHRLDWHMRQDGDTMYSQTKFFDDARNADYQRIRHSMLRSKKETFYKYQGKITNVHHLKKFDDVKRNKILDDLAKETGIERKRVRDFFDDEVYRGADFTDKTKDIIEFEFYRGIRNSDPEKIMQSIGLHKKLHEYVDDADFSKIRNFTKTKSSSDDLGVVKTLSDLFDGITEGRVRSAKWKHSKDYYKRNDLRRNTEIFANMNVINHQGGLADDIMKHLFPSIHEEYETALKNYLIHVEKKQPKRLPAPDSDLDLTRQTIDWTEVVSRYTDIDEFLNYDVLLDSSDLKNKLVRWAEAKWGRQKPNVLKGADFDNMEGQIYARGLTDKKHMKSELESLTDGKGINGDGLYFSRTNISQSMFVTNATEYADAKNWHVYTVKLDPKAKIISLDELKKTRNPEIEAKLARESIDIENMDPARLAVMTGYDAILDGTELQIINRSIVFVDERSLPKGEFYKGRKTTKDITLSRMHQAYHKKSDVDMDPEEIQSWELFETLKEELASPSEGHGNMGIVALARKKWGDQSHQIVDGKEFDKIETPPYVRGIQDKDHLESNLKGTSGAKGIHADGLHFGQISKEILDPNHPAMYIYSGQNGWLYTAKLAPDSKIVDYDKLLNDMKVDTDNFPKQIVVDKYGEVVQKNTSQYINNQDMASKAILLGYDAIHGPKGMLIVLNRSKVIVDKRSLPNGDFYKFTRKIDFGLERHRERFSSRLLKTYFDDSDIDFEPEDLKIPVANPKTWDQINRFFKRSPDEIKWQRESQININSRSAKVSAFAPLKKLVNIGNRSYYDRHTKTLNIANKDPYNPNDQASFLHEQGHHIDNTLGGGNGTYFSSGNKFQQAVDIDRSNTSRIVVPSREIVDKEIENFAKLDIAQQDAKLNLFKMNHGHIYDLAKINKLLAKEGYLAEELSSRLSQESKNIIQYSILKAIERKDVELFIHALQFDGRIMKHLAKEPYDLLEDIQYSLDFNVNKGGVARMFSDAADAISHGEFKGLRFKHRAEYYEKYSHRRNSEIFANTMAIEAADDTAYQIFKSFFPNITDVIEKKIDNYLLLESRKMNVQIARMKQDEGVVPQNISPIVLEKDLPSYNQQRIADIYQNDHIKNFLEKLKNLMNKSYVEITDDLKETFSEKRVSQYIGIKMNKFADILSDGEVKNKYQTRSGTFHTYTPEERFKGFEKRIFNLDDADLNDLRNLPKYGFVDGKETISSLSALTYGPLIIRMKNRVRDKSTITLGDSMNNNPRLEPGWEHVAPAVPINQVSSDLLYSAARRNIDNTNARKIHKWIENKDIQEFNDGFGLGHEYTETQIFGKLTPDDIDAVLVKNSEDAIAIRRLLAVHPRYEHIQIVTNSINPFENFPHTNTFVGELKLTPTDIDRLGDAYIEKIIRKIEQGRDYSQMGVQIRDFVDRNDPRLYETIRARIRMYYSRNASGPNLTDDIFDEAFLESPDAKGTIKPLYFDEKNEKVSTKPFVDLDDFDEEATDEALRKRAEARKSGGESQRRFIDAGGGGSSDSVHFETRIQEPGGATRFLETSIMDRGNIVTIDFSVDGSYDAVPSANARAIFRQVETDVIDYINANNPDAITFSANRLQKFNIYWRAFNRLAKAYNAKLDLKAGEVALVFNGRLSRPDLTPEQIKAIASAELRVVENTRMRAPISRSIADPAIAQMPQSAATEYELAREFLNRIGARQRQRVMRRIENEDSIDVLVDEMGIVDENVNTSAVAYWLRAIVSNETGIEMPSPNDTFQRQLVREFVARSDNEIDHSNIAYALARMRILNDNPETPEDLLAMRDNLISEGYSVELANSATRQAHMILEEDYGVPIDFPDEIGRSTSLLGETPVHRPSRSISSSRIPQERIDEYNAAGRAMARLRQAEYDNYENFGPSDIQQVRSELLLSHGIDESNIDKAMNMFVAMVRNETGIEILTPERPIQPIASRPFSPVALNEADSILYMYARAGIQTFPPEELAVLTPTRFLLFVDYFKNEYGFGDLQSNKISAMMNEILRDDFQIDVELPNEISSLVGTRLLRPEVESETVRIQPIRGTLGPTRLAGADRYGVVASELIETDRRQYQIALNYIRMLEDSEENRIRRYSGDYTEIGAELEQLGHSTEDVRGAMIWLRAMFHERWQIGHEINLRPIVRHQRSLETRGTGAVDSDLDMTIVERNLRDFVRDHYDPDIVLRWTGDDAWEAVDNYLAAHQIDEPRHLLYRDLLHVARRNYGTRDLFEDMHGWENSARRVFDNLDDAAIATMESDRLYDLVSDFVKAEGVADPEQIRDIYDSFVNILRGHYLVDIDRETFKEFDISLVPNLPDRDVSPPLVGNFYRQEDVRDIVRDFNSIYTSNPRENGAVEDFLEYVRFRIEKDWNDVEPTDIRRIENDLNDLTSTIEIETAKILRDEYGIEIDGNRLVPPRVIDTDGIDFEPEDADLGFDPGNWGGKLVKVSPENFKYRYDRDINLVNREKLQTLFERTLKKKLTEFVNDTIKNETDFDWSLSSIENELKIYEKFRSSKFAKGLDLSDVPKENIASEGGIMGGRLFNTEDLRTFHRQIQKTIEQIKPKIPIDEKFKVPSKFSSVKSFIDYSKKRFDEFEEDMESLLSLYHKQLPGFVGPRQNAGIRKYDTTNVHNEINDSLRNGTPLSKEAQEVYDDMMSAMKPLEENFDVFRFSSVIGDKNIKVGDIGESKFLVSTTTEPSYLHFKDAFMSWMQPTEVWHIEVPKGTPAIIHNAYQKEITLAPGTRFKILAIEKGEASGEGATGHLHTYIRATVVSDKSDADFDFEPEDVKFEADFDFEPEDFIPKDKEIEFLWVYSAQRGAVLEVLEMSNPDKIENWTIQTIDDIAMRLIDDIDFIGETFDPSDYDTLRYGLHRELLQMYGRRIPNAPEFDTDSLFGSPSPKISFSSIPKKFKDADEFSVFIDKRHEDIKNKNGDIQETLYIEHRNTAGYIPTKQKLALEEYSGTKYLDLNSMLRNNEELTTELKKLNKELWNNTFELNEDVYVFRYSNVSNQKEYKKGGIAESNYWVSTTREPTLIFHETFPSDSISEVYQIKIPKGTRVLIHNLKEMEITLPPGTKIRIDDMNHVETKRPLDSNYLKSDYYLDRPDLTYPQTYIRATVVSDKSDADFDFEPGDAKFESDFDFEPEDFDFEPTDELLKRKVEHRLQTGRSQDRHNASYLEQHQRGRERRVFHSNTRDGHALKTLFTLDEDSQDKPINIDFSIDGSYETVPSTNPMAIIRQVETDVIDFVNVEKPLTLTFSTDNYKKAQIYWRLAERMRKAYGASYDVENNRLYVILNFKDTNSRPESMMPLDEIKRTFIINAGMGVGYGPLATNVTRWLIKYEKELGIKINEGNLFRNSERLQNDADNTFSIMQIDDITRMDLDEVARIVERESRSNASPEQLFKIFVAHLDILYTRYGRTDFGDDSDLPEELINAGNQAYLRMRDRDRRFDFEPIDEDLDFEPVDELLKQRIMQRGRDGISYDRHVAAIKYKIENKIDRTKFRRFVYVSQINGVDIKTWFDSDFELNQKLKIPLSKSYIDIDLDIPKISELENVSPIYNQIQRDVIDYYNTHIRFSGFIFKPSSENERRIILAFATKLSDALDGKVETINEPNRSYILLHLKEREVPDDYVDPDIPGPIVGAIDSDGGSPPMVIATISPKIVAEIENFVDEIIEDFGKEYFESMDIKKMRDFSAGLYGDLEAYDLIDQRDVRTLVERALEKRAIKPKYFGPTLRLVKDESEDTDFDFEPVDELLKQRAIARKENGESERRYRDSFWDPDEVKLSSMTRDNRLLVTTFKRRHSIIEVFFEISGEFGRIQNRYPISTLRQVERDLIDYINAANPEALAFTVADTARFEIYWRAFERFAKAFDAKFDFRDGQIALVFRGELVEPDLTPEKIKLIARPFDMDEFDFDAEPVDMLASNRIVHMLKNKIKQRKDTGLSAARHSEATLMPNEKFDKPNHLYVATIGGHRVETGFDQIDPNDGYVLRLMPNEKLSDFIEVAFSVDDMIIGKIDSSHALAIYRQIEQDVIDYYNSNPPAKGFVFVPYDRSRLAVVSKFVKRAAAAMNADLDIDYNNGTILRFPDPDADRDIDFEPSSLGDLEFDLDAVDNLLYASAEVFSDEQKRFIAFLDELNQNPPSGYGNMTALHFAKERFGDQAHQIVDEFDFDELDGRILYRGIRREHDLEANLNGTAASKGTKIDGLHFAIDSVHAWERGIGGHVYAVKLASDAKVVKLRDLLAEKERFRPSKANRELSPNSKSALRNLTNFAIFRGYDAVDMGDGDYVILNRGKVVVDKRSLPDGDFYIQGRQVAPVKMREAYHKEPDVDFEPEDMGFDFEPEDLPFTGNEKTWKELDTFKRKKIETDLHDISWKDLTSLEAKSAALTRQLRTIIFDPGQGLAGYYRKATKTIATTEWKPTNAPLAEMVWRHEYGHYIDDMIGGPRSLAYGTNTKKFENAMKKDLAIYEAKFSDDPIRLDNTALNNFNRKKQPESELNALLDEFGFTKEELMDFIDNKTFFAHWPSDVDVDPEKFKIAYMYNLLISLKSKNLAQITYAFHPWGQFQRVMVSVATHFNLYYDTNRLHLDRLAGRFRTSAGGHFAWPMHDSIDALVQFSGRRNVSIGAAWKHSSEYYEWSDFNTRKEIFANGVAIGGLDPTSKKLWAVVFPNISKEMDRMLNLYVNRQTKAYRTRQVKKIRLEPYRIGYVKRHRVRELNTHQQLVRAAKDAGFNEHQMAILNRNLLAGLEGEKDWQRERLTWIKGPAFQERLKKMGEQHPELDEMLDLIDRERGFDVNPSMSVPPKTWIEMDERLGDRQKSGELPWHEESWGNLNSVVARAVAKYVKGPTIIQRSSRAYYNRHDNVLDMNAHSRRTKKGQGAFLHEFGHHLDNTIGNETGAYWSSGDTFKSVVKKARARIANGELTTAENTVPKIQAIRFAERDSQFRKKALDNLAKDVGISKENIREFFSREGYLLAENTIAREIPENVKDAMDYFLLQAIKENNVENIIDAMTYGTGSRRIVHNIDANVDSNTIAQMISSNATSTIRAFSDLADAVSHGKIRSARFKHSASYYSRYSHRRNSEIFANSIQIMGQSELSNAIFAKVFPHIHSGIENAVKRFGAKSENARFAAVDRIIPIERWNPIEFEPVDTDMRLLTTTNEFIEELIRERDKTLQLFKDFDPIPARRNHELLRDYINWRNYDDLKDYTFGSNYMLNLRLRKGVKLDPESARVHKGMIRLLRKTLQEHRIFRAIEFGDQIPIAKGQVVGHKSWTSGGTDVGLVVSQHVKVDSALWDIKIPKRTKAIVTNESETEIILPPGTTMRILEVREIPTDEAIQSQIKRHIIAEVVDDDADIDFEPEDIGDVDDFFTGEEKTWNELQKRVGPDQRSGLEVSEHQNSWGDLTSKAAKAAVLSPPIRDISRRTSELGAVYYPNERKIYIRPLTESADVRAYSWRHEFGHYIDHGAGGFADKFRTSFDAHNTMVRDDIGLYMPRLNHQLMHEMFRNGAFDFENAPAYQKALEFVGRGAKRNELDELASRVGTTRDEMYEVFTSHGILRPDISGDLFDETQKDILIYTLLSGIEGRDLHLIMNTLQAHHSLSRLLGRTQIEVDGVWRKLRNTHDAHGFLPTLTDIAAFMSSGYVRALAAHTREYYDGYPSRALAEPFANAVSANGLSPVTDKLFSLIYPNIHKHSMEILNEWIESRTSFVLHQAEQKKLVNHRNLPETHVGIQARALYNRQQLVEAAKYAKLPERDLAQLIEMLDAFDITMELNTKQFRERIAVFSLRNKEFADLIADIDTRRQIPNAPKFLASVRSWTDFNNLARTALIQEEDMEFIIGLANDRHQKLDMWLTVSPSSQAADHVRFARIIEDIQIGLARNSNLPDFESAVDTFREIMERRARDGTSRGRVQQAIGSNPDSANFKTTLPNGDLLATKIHKYGDEIDLVFEVNGSTTYIPSDSPFQIFRIVEQDLMDFLNMHPDATIIKFSASPNRADRRRRLYRRFATRLGDVFGTSPAISPNNMHFTVGRPAPLPVASTLDNGTLRFESDSIDSSLVLTSRNDVTDLSGLVRINGAYANLDAGDSALESLGDLTIVGGNVDLDRSPILSLGNLTNIGGRLRISETNLTTLGNLERIGGSLFARNSKLDSLGNLKEVNGDFILTSTRLHSLENLQKISGKAILTGDNFNSIGELREIGELRLFDTKIVSLEKLEKADLIKINSQQLDNFGKLNELHDLEITNSSIGSFEGLKKIDKLQIIDSHIHSFGKLEKVGKLHISDMPDIDLSGISGLDFLEINNVRSVNLTDNVKSIKAINIRHSIVDSFENIEEINELLYLMDTTISSFGKIRIIRGPLKISNMTIDSADASKSLGNIEAVDGTFLLRNTNLDSLGNLRAVGSNMELIDNLQLKSLGNLESVDRFGEIIISRTPIESFGKLVKAGKIKFTGQASSLKSLGKLNHARALILQHSSLKSLDNLEYVDSHLDLRHSAELKSLGKLKAVGSDLNLSHTRIESLDNLENVGGNLDLEGADSLKSLGKLKTVGGSLDLKYSPLESLDELESVMGSIDLAGSDVKSLGNLKKASAVYLDSTQKHLIPKLEERGIRHWIVSG